MAVEEGERILREAEAERAGSTRIAQDRLSWAFDAATATTLGREESGPRDEPPPLEQMVADKVPIAEVAGIEPDEPPTAQHQDQEQNLIPLDDLTGPDLDLDLDGDTKPGGAAKERKRGFFRRNKKG